MGCMRDLYFAKEQREPMNARITACTRTDWIDARSAVNVPMSGTSSTSLGIGPDIDRSDQPPAGYAVGIIAIVKIAFPPSCISEPKYNFDNGCIYSGEVPALFVRGNNATCFTGSHLQ